MNEPKQPRKLNTGSASGRSSTPSGSTGRRINRSGSPASGSGQQRTVYHASEQPRRQAQPPRQDQPQRKAQPAAHRGQPRRRPKKKKSPLKIALISLLTLVTVVCVGLFGLYQWVVHSISPDGGTPSINELINTPSEYKGDVVNILVCGIDYEEGRAYSNDPTSNDGMTDMIMYVNFNVKEKKINMLQIPRDTYAGEEYSTGRTGKINAVALRNEGGITDLAKLITEQYKLPIDYYVTIDMQSLKEIVDLFGGIEVYLPQEVADGKGSHLPAGPHNLDGASVEFLVRNRHGDGYAQGDIARLDMQRYFYQGLFNRIRTATVWDLAKLTPVALKYITTDIPGDTLVSLGVSFLQVDSANIMMCKVPTYSAAERYNGQSIQVCDTTKTLELINTYFLSYTTPVDSLNVPTLATAGSSTDPNVQYMGQLDTEAEGGSASEAG